MKLHTLDLDALDQRHRARLVNSLSGFKSANLVGTINQEGQDNLSIVSSVFHLGAKPTLLGMIIRPASVPRHTLENLLETGYYTINHVNTGMIEQAHQTSARYDRAVSEFDAVGFSREFSSLFAAPYVAESRLKLGVKLVSTQTLEVNSTVLVIGEVIEILTEDSVVQADGYIDIEALDSVCLSGLDSYHEARRVSRYSYAKTDRQPTPLALDGRSNKDSKTDS